MYNSKRMATKMIGIILGLVSAAIILTGCGHDIESENSGISETTVSTNATATTEESTASTTSTAVTTTSAMSTTSTISSSTTAVTTTTTSVETVVNETVNESTELKVETVNNEPSNEVNNPEPLVVEIEPISETATETLSEANTSATEEVVIEIEVTKKTVEEVAKEVWEGKWGNGAYRKARLEEAGYDYDEVQKAVSELRSSYTPVNNDTTVNGNMTYVKNFSRGTYYAYGGARYGGSGRSLIDCSYGDGTVKGSIASSYLYNTYGYNYNGKRTMVYLEVSGYSSMNGYYYLDDCDAGNPNVIDFFYLYNSNCQFQYDGVVSVYCYIVSY